MIYAKKYSKSPRFPNVATNRARPSSTLLVFEKMFKRNMCQTLRVHSRKSYIMTHSLRMSRCLEADTKPRDIESDRFASGTYCGPHYECLTNTAHNVYEKKVVEDATCLVREMISTTIHRKQSTIYKRAHTICNHQ